MDTVRAMARRAMTFAPVARRILLLLASRPKALAALLALLGFAGVHLAPETLGYLVSAGGELVDLVLSLGDSTQ